MMLAIDAGYTVAELKVKGLALGLVANHGNLAELGLLNFSSNP